MDTLRQWHEFLNPTEIFDKFQQLLYSIRSLPEEDQLCRYVHGKLFFKDHVVKQLNNLIEQHGEGYWKNELFKTLPVSTDLEPLWQKMGLI